MFLIVVFHQSSISHSPIIESKNNKIVDIDKETDRDRDKMKNKEKNKEGEKKEKKKEKNFKSIKKDKEKNKRNLKRTPETKVLQEVNRLLKKMMTSLAIIIRKLK